MVETRDSIDRVRAYVELAVRVHDGNIAEAAETCRWAAEWWSAVNQDTAALWQRVADTLDALALAQQEEQLQ